MLVAMVDQLSAKLNSLHGEVRSMDSRQDWVDQLSAKLNALQGDILSIESRQVHADTRIAQLDSLVQGMQEENFVQSCSLERGQKSTDLRAKQAINSVVALQRQVEQEDAMSECLNGLMLPPGGWASEVEKRFEAKLEEHRRWLMKISREVTTLASATAEVRAIGHHQVLAIKEDAQNAASVGARLSALDSKMQKVALSAKRALHASIVLQQQQQSSEHELEWQRCLMGPPRSESPSRKLTEVEQQWAARFNQQDQRLERIIHMVDTLADRVMAQASNASFERESIADKAAADMTAKLSHLKEQVESMAQLREKVEEMEAALLFSLASQSQPPAPAPAPALAAPPTPGTGAIAGASPNANANAFPGGAERVMEAIDGFEARIGRGLTDVRQRVEALEGVTEQQRLALSQVCRQIPEMRMSLDQLSEQCQQCFPRVKEHEVRLNLFRESFDSQRRDVLDLMEGLERQKPRDREGVERQRPRDWDPRSTSLFGRDGDIARGRPATQPVKPDTFKDRSWSPRLDRNW